MNQTNVNVSPAKVAMKPCYLAMSSDVIRTPPLDRPASTRRFRNLPSLFVSHGRSPSERVFRVRVNAVRSVAR